MRRRSLLCVAGVLLAAVTLVAAACGASGTRRAPSAAPRPPVQAPVDIVVQGAVDTELQPLLAALRDAEVVQIAAWTFWRGTLGGRRVVVSRTEVGPINAAAATTLAIEHFRPRVIINQGTAGAAIPDLDLFDIVVGEATVDYSAFRTPHVDAGGGVDAARWEPMPHRLRLGGGERVAFRTFPGDPDLLQQALATPYGRGRVRQGVIGSAFQFNREVDRLVWINRTYGAISEDMESAFAAGVAVGYGTRFLAIRIISDSDFRHTEFHREAGEYCAAFVVDLLARLPAR